MKKIDATISTIIGFLIGVFFFIALKNIGKSFPYSWLLLVIFPPLALLGMFVASFIGKKLLIIYQAAKFVLVGALNTFIDLGVLNGLIWVSGIATGIWYSAFKGTSFLLATINSYFWNKHWTFRKREKVFAPREYLKFLITVTIGLFINIGIASFVVNIIGPQYGLTEKMWANVGAFIAVLIAWVWNFLASKFIVFKS